MVLETKYMIIFYDIIVSISSDMYKIKYYLVQNYRKQLCLKNTKNH